MRGTVRAREPCDERIDLAAEADAEGRVEERRHEREAGGDQAEKRDACGESDGADHREHEADQLGELQRRHGFLLGDGSETGSDEALEDQAVGMLTGPAPCADREDDGLDTQDHGCRDRAERRCDQRRDDHDGGDPGGEPGATHVHHGRCGRIGAGRHGSRLLLRWRGWG